MIGIPRKDPFLNEAIEILDAHLVRCKRDLSLAFNTLSSVYSEFVNEEIAKCMTNPRYYLENYHIVKTKNDGFKTLYPFWDSQEIIYSEIMGLLAVGKPAKILIDKARQLGSCLDPDTPILTDDLRWIPIGEVEPGQGLVSVEEEFRGGRGKGREMKQAHVVARRDVFEPAFRLVMSNGSTLVATGPHRFLSRARGGVSTIWRTVEKMKVGDAIRHIVKPWSEPTVEDGWFGGFTDGEGCLRVKHWGGVEVSVSQRFNEAYDRALSYLQSHGYTFRVEVDHRKSGNSSKFGNEPVAKLVINRLGEILRLMGQTRPARFTGKTWWEGKDIPGRTGEGEAWSEIVAIEPLGKKRMIDLQTTTKTYIANGFVSHNSTLSEGLIFHHTIFTEANNTLIVAQDPGQADYLFSMSMLAFKNLPWWLQPMVLYRSKGRYLVLGSEIPGMTGLNSEIFVEAANKLSGVSVGKTIHCAHLSELSSWDNAKILTEQIFPAMSGNNVIAILESTARGRNGFWYDFWCESIESWGEEDWEWKPVFVEWFRCREYSVPIENKAAFELTEEETAIRAKIQNASDYTIPDEQFNWRRIKRKETIKITGDDTSFLQEYPITHQESFQTSGLCAFPKKLLQEIMNTSCCDPLWYGEMAYSHGAAQEIKLHLTATFDEVEKNRTGNTVYKRDRVIPPAKKYGGRLRVWEQPEAGEAYYVAGDPAHGLEGGDFSCAEVMKIGHGMEPDAQVAEWHGWINPSPFGHILVGLAKWYNGAELSLELNAVGERTYIEVFRILEYSNLFRWKHYDKVKNFWSDYMAWLTTSKTRDLIITNMRERIMEKNVILRSYDLLDQMMDFSSEEEGSKFEGQNTNDDRVMACFPAGTMVKTGRGNIPIEDVKPHDAVLSHDGYWHGVTEIGNRPVNEEIVKLETWGLAAPATCTEEHPILAKIRTRSCPVRFGEAVWTNAVGLNKGDAVFVPVAPLLHPAPLTDNELYLLGWCLADGHCSMKSGAVKITLGKGESECANVLKFIIERIVNKHPTEWFAGVGRLGKRTRDSVVTVKDHGEWITVSCSNRWLCAWIKKWIGEPNNKRVHDSIKNGSDNLPFVVGFLEGDGSQKNTRGAMDVCQKNHAVLWDIRNMLMRNGVWASISPKLTKDGQSRMSIGVPWMNKLLSIFPGCLYRQFKRKLDHPIARWDGVGFWVILKAVSRQKYSGLVYNMEVDDAHSYTANELAVHNCMICLWCAHDSDYGKQAAMVPKADGGHKKYYVIDDVNRVVFTSEQKDEAYAAAYVKTEARNVKGEVIPTHAVMRPGWSVAHRPNKKDFNNSDFSPVHDKAGPRAQIHAYGVPAESIRLDNLQDWETMRSSQDTDRSWMEI